MCCTLGNELEGAKKLLLSLFLAFTWHLFLLLLCHDCFEVTWKLSGHIWTLCYWILVVLSSLWPAASVIVTLSSLNAKMPVFKWLWSECLPAIPYVQCSWKQLLVSEDSTGIVPYGELVVLDSTQEVSIIIPCHTVNHAPYRRKHTKQCSSSRVSCTCV